MALPDLDLPDADGLLIVPPFAHLTWPALGVHVLQACARARGHRVAVLYANLLYAREIGPVAYAAVCNAPMDWLLGERMFARAAWGVDALGADREGFWASVARHDAEVGVERAEYVDHLSDASGVDSAVADARYPRDALLARRDLGEALITELAAAIAAKGYRFVGASTTFEQTSSSWALLRAIKAHDPAIVTILGGANCERGMAEGVVTLGEGVDHVFSGESEGAFVRFVAGLARGERPAERIVRGEPLRDMEGLPEVRYDEYFRQVARWLPALDGVPLWLTYESSRGCWWGEKSHCTFCGLNGSGMAFRQKSPDKVLGELRRLLALAPTNRINITDNIMPHAYHKTLVPRLAAEGPSIHAFYEMKSNLTLPQMKGLQEAGILAIQAGIESLNSPTLRLMRKGVTARQNVATMRYARLLGLGLKWNLLYGFPGDEAAWYAETLELLRRVRHLTPPHALGHMSIERFSPYFEQADAFGIRELRPMPAYFEAFPPGAAVRDLAYHFVGAYDSGSEADTAGMDALRAEISAWRQAWDAPPERRPALWVAPAGAQWALYDTRGLGGPQMVYLSEAQAAAVLVGGPLDRVPLAKWALRYGYGFETDGWCVPLALAPYEVLLRFEEKWRHEAPDEVLRVLGVG